MGTEIQSLYEKDKSTNLLLHVLRLILEHTDAKSDVMEYISYKMAKMQTQVQRMQGYIFEIVRRLYAIENFIQDWENKRDRYNNIYEELVEWYLKLEKCLDEIKENLKILSKIRLPQTLTVSFNSELIHLIFSWFNEAVKRSGEFIKLLQDSPNQLPEPDKSYPIRTLSSSERNSVALLFQQLSKLKAEYLTNTKPTQKEFREPDFKTLFSNSEYEPRDEQEQYAWFIREAINVSGVYAIEAGTGTGKTLGYLSPVCEHIRLNKDRQVIVATSTINLMDQIIAKEWPILVSKRDFLYHDLQIAILAGKRNYLCTSALKRFFHTLNPIENEQDISQKNGTLIHSDDRLAWLYLFQILTRKNGQWDSIDNFSKKYPRIAKEFEIDLDAENACKPNLCRMGQNCSFPQAVRRAQFAHVLITNHHKLVKLEAEIQKRASVCIIDEADQFPDNLRSALSESLSKKDVMNFIRRVGGGTKNRRGFVQILHDGLEETQSKCESALESLSKIEESCHQIGKCLFNSTKSASNIKEKRWKNLSPNHQSILSQVLKNIAEQFCIIGHELTQIFKSNPEIFGVTKNEEKTEFFDRMNRYIYDAEEFRAVTKSLMSAIGSNEFIVTYNQKSYDWTITKTPFSIRNDVKRVTGSFETAVLTSATLYVDETLNLLLTELLDDEASKDLFVAEKKILSPPPLFISNCDLSPA